MNDPGGASFLGRFCLLTIRSAYVRHPPGQPRPTASRTRERGAVKALQRTRRPRSEGTRPTPDEGRPVAADVGDDEGDRASSSRNLPLDPQRHLIRAAREGDDDADTDG